MKLNRSNTGLAMLASVALLGCATVDVRGIGSGGRESAYELHGATLAELDIEAKRLCPNGYEALHRWQRYHRPQNESGNVASWWNRVTDLVSPPSDNDAQLTVLCKGAA